MTTSPGKAELIARRIAAGRKLTTLRLFAWIVLVGFAVAFIAPTVVALAQQAWWHAVLYILAISAGLALALYLWIPRTHMEGFVMAILWLVVCVLLAIFVIDVPYEALMPRPRFPSYLP